MGSDSEDDNEESCFSRYLKMIIAVVSLIMAVISYSSASKAYDHLSEVSEDYNFLLDHWQRKPIQDIKIVGPSESCPAGYELGIGARNGNDGSRVGVWDGTNTYCDARPEGYSYTVTEYRCRCTSSDDSSYETSWSQTSPSCTRSGCYVATQQTTYNFQTAAGSCNQTQVNAGMAEDPGKSRVELNIWRGRKLCYKRGGWAAMRRASVADGCPGGVVCGSGSYQDTLSTCAPSVDECPVTSMSSLAEAMGGGTQLTLSSGANGASVEGLPINEVWMVMNKPCWHGPQGIKNRDNTSPRLKNMFNVGCEAEDVRFELWDQLEEKAVFTQNNVPVSGGQQIGGKNNYPVENVQTFNYSTYSYQWAYYFRREQYWDPDCDLGLMDRVEGYEDDIETVKNTQYSLLIMNGIFTLGFSIIYCIFVFVHNCDDNLDSDWIPGHGAQEQKNIDNCQSIATVVAIICRSIPLILCLVMTKAMESWMNKAQVSDCSRPKDGLTDETIRNAGRQMETVYDTNVQVLIFDILNFLLIFAPIIYNKCTAEEESEEGAETKKESGGCCGGDDSDSEDPETGGAKQGNIEQYIEMEQSEQAQANPYMPYMQQAAPGYTTDGQVDANNDGIPDIYQTNLPPGWECRMDPNSGKPYWIDHSNQNSSWIDPRTMPQFQQQQQVVPQYGGMAMSQEVPEQYTYGLAPNWEAKMDPNSNRVYWVDHNTQQSTWVDPRQAANPYNPYG